MKLFILYSDSLAQKEKYEQIATIEKQYETVKKENKIVRLQAEQELTLIQLRKNKQLKQLGMATALLLLLLVFFISMKYIDKIKSNQLLKEKNQLIEQSEQELRLLNASKNKFFSIIAHDLKNPLHTILGYSYLLNKDYDRFNEEARRKFALNIHQSTNNIFRLLQNLLEWSRSQTGRLNFSPAVVEYQRILDNSLSVLRSMADQKNIVIKAENDPELEIFADPLMIETVLRNLIGNAIKFTPEGGQIDVSAKRENGQILVSVSDTGIGITEEDTKNLFLIDSKVKRKGTNNEDGSGLGLILCQEFVDKHDGKIWVESTPGKGSAFTFSIPAKAIA
jgi:signal transduction histidine kinase